MKLSKKMLIFSVSIALVLMLFLLLYFIVLMPNLYLAQRKENTIALAKNLHEGFIKERSYRNLTPDNYFSNFSVVIPKTGYELQFSNKFGNMRVSVENESVKKLIDGLRKLDYNSDNPELSQEAVFALIEEVKLPPLEGFSVDISLNINTGQSMDNARTEYYALSKGVLLANILEQDNLQYVSFIALSDLDNEFIMTMLPTMYDSLSEITPVALGSLPMILLAILVTTFAASQYFAKSVIKPIQQIQNHACTLKNRSPSDWTNLNLEGKDELAMLSGRLDEVHQELKKHYENISAEKERQELFVRASSHELKTPLASALLLCDGMIAKIGKYEDTEAYLPELRKILLSMQKMLQEILLLRSDGDEYALVDFRTLAERVAEQNSILCEQQDMRIEIQGNLQYKTWTNLAYKVMETLIGNAVQHGEPHSVIRVMLYDKGFQIWNQGNIEPQILNNIFEPFVSGAQSKGHGLGLYIVNSYAKLLKWQINIQNEDKGVNLICKMK